jgi:hypothetical protein
MDKSRKLNIMSHLNKVGYKIPSIGRNMVPSINGELEDTFIVTY